MSKLFKLKNWLTIEEAARHLSGAFTESVNEADVLRLALDGHLKLSVNFVNPVEVKLGTLIAKEDVPYEEVLGKNGQNFRSYISKQHVTDDGDIYIFNEEDPVYTLRGVCDIPMLGGFRLEVERQCHSMTGGPKVTERWEHDVLIEAGDNQSCQFEMRWDESEIPDDFDSAKSLIGQMAASPLSSDQQLEIFKNGLAIMRRTSKYCLADRLPEQISLVVRRNALTDFISSVSDTPANAERSLKTIERDTLLKLVIGMAIKGYSYDPTALKSPIPKEIEGDLAALDLKVTDETILKYLKEAVTTVLPGENSKRRGKPNSV